MADVFITWNRDYSYFIDFLYKSMISKLLPQKTIVHVFIPSGMPDNDRPMPASWIHTHECMKNTPGASETSLIAYIMQNYAMHNQDKDENRPYDSKRALLLVQTSPEQHEEFVLILKRFQSFSKMYDVRILTINNALRDAAASSNTPPYCSSAKLRMKYTSDKHTENKNTRDKPFKSDKLSFGEEKGHVYANEGKYLCHEEDGNDDNEFCCCCGFAEENARKMAAEAYNGIPVRRSWPSSAKRQFVNHNNKDSCQFCGLRSYGRQESEFANINPVRLPQTRKELRQSGRDKCLRCLEREKMENNDGKVISMQDKSYSNIDLTECDCKNRGSLYLCEICLEKHVFRNFSKAKLPEREKSPRIEQATKTNMSKLTNKSTDKRSESAPLLNFTSSNKSMKINNVQTELTNQNTEPHPEPKSRPVSTNEKRESEFEVNGEILLTNQRTESKSGHAKPLFEDENSPARTDDEFADSTSEEIKKIEKENEDFGERPNSSQNGFEDGIFVASVKKGAGSELVNSATENPKTETSTISNNLDVNFTTRGIQSTLQIKLYSAIGCQTDQTEAASPVQRRSLSSAQNLMKTPDDVTSLRSISTSPIHDWLQTPVKRVDASLEDDFGSINIEKDKKSLKYDYELFDDLENEKLVQNRANSKKPSKLLNEKKLDIPKDGEYSCEFCPKRKFKSYTVWKVHMKNSHKKCNCPCGAYFETRSDYLMHFYRQFPLACFIERKCPDRFRSLYYQAVHHRDKHFCETPFFCVVCFNSEDAIEMKRKFCFKDIKSLRIHAESYEHDPKSMFLISSINDTDNSYLPWTMKCNGINFS